LECTNGECKNKVPVKSEEKEWFVENRKRVLKIKKSYDILIDVELF
jgi:hypothetical protein